MAFDWLHMPSHNGYNRLRHLSRTPPEFWSRDDRYHAGWERSKYMRKLYKERKRHGTSHFLTPSVPRAFHVDNPGGTGYYFPYEGVLPPVADRRFRDGVDEGRGLHRFAADFVGRRYGDPDVLDALALRGGVDSMDDVDVDDFMDFVEWETGRPAVGPLGTVNRGDRPNVLSADMGTGLLPFGARGQLWG